MISETKLKAYLAKSKLPLSCKELEAWLTKTQKDFKFCERAIPKTELKDWLYVWLRVSQTGRFNIDYNRCLSFHDIMSLVRGVYTDNVKLITRQQTEMSVLIVDDYIEKLINDGDDQLEKLNEEA